VYVKPSIPKFIKNVHLSILTYPDTGAGADTNHIIKVHIMVNIENPAAIIPHRLSGVHALPRAGAGIPHCAVSEANRRG